MSLSAKDYKAILELIELTYATPDRAQVLQTVCERLQKLNFISSAVFIPRNPINGQWQFQDHFLFNCQVRELMDWIQYYHQFDPFNVSGWFQKTTNKAACYTDFISEFALAESEFGCDFLPRVPLWYCLSAILGSQGDPTGAIGLHRSKSDHNFTDRDKEIMNLLFPHLSRALHNLNLLDTIASAQGCGMIVMRPDGSPSYMNEEARRALNGRPITTVPDPRCSTVPAFFQSETGSYRVRTIPAGRNRTQKIILLEPLPSDHDLKAKLANFGLSPRQEEIAILVIRGLSNREIADRLFISEQTVKDHLRDIFEKLKVHRRSELIAKVFGIDREAK
jgi:DNA-binding CsgD family transcriptional regulator